MNVYIIGVGLIGGSMALDIKFNYDNVTIFGIDTNENYLDEALNLNIIDKKASIPDLADADFVILAVPVDIALVILPSILDIINDDSLVFDVGSTKFSADLISNGNFAQTNKPTEFSSYVQPNFFANSKVRFLRF